MEDDIRYGMEWKGFVEICEVIHSANLEVEGDLITFSTEDLANYTMLEWWIMITHTFTYYQMIFAYCVVLWRGLQVLVD